MTRPTSAEVLARIESAMSSGCPQFYFNGFVNATTLGDMVVVVEKNGSPVAVLNMSYTVAKSLSVALSGAIGQFEEATKRSMLTTNEVEEAMSRENSSSEE